MLAKRRSDLPGFQSYPSDLTSMVAEKGGNQDLALQQLAATGQPTRGHRQEQCMTSDRGLEKTRPKATPIGRACLDTHFSVRRLFLRASGTPGSEPLLPSSPKPQPSSGCHPQASSWNPTSWPDPALQSHGLLHPLGRLCFWQPQQQS